MSSRAKAEHLARVAVDLVRGLVTTVLDNARPIGGTHDATLTLRLNDYLRVHWPEHHLTADRLASAHQISTQHLYQLLSAQGITLGDWLR